MLLPFDTKRLYSDGGHGYESTSRPGLDVLVSFSPAHGQERAAEAGAWRGLRKDKSPDAFLRALLIHLGCGHSLRETVVRARQASLVDLSAVALFKRLRKSRHWLYQIS